jgi:hypothetical protein
MIHNNFILSKEKSSGSGTGSTQLLDRKVAAPVYKLKNTA